MTVTPTPFSFSLREVTSSLVEIYLKSSDDVTRYVIKLTIMGDDATVERKEIVVDKEKEEMLFQLTMLPAGFLLVFVLLCIFYCRVFISKFFSVSTVFKALYISIYILDIVNVFVYFIENRKL